jgi:hypothetical protein
MTTPLGSVTGGGKFVLDKAVVGDIMKHDPNLIAAVDAAARKVLPDAGPNAQVHYYTTDRHVAGISVPAIEQARDGRLTKAAGLHGARVTGGGAS